MTPPPKTNTERSGTSDTPSGVPLRPHRGGRPRLQPWSTCPVCQREFKASSAQKQAIANGRAAHCSRACQRASTTETRPCATCGTEVVRAASDGGFRGIRAFCSAACRSKQSMKPRVRVIVPCATCGKEVERTPSALAAAGNVAYCDRRCKAEAMRGQRVERPERPCETCGVTMRLEPDDVAHGRRFCSRACASVAKRRKPGERYIDSRGYAWITTADGRSMMEHSYVMEGMLGRRVLPTETVHHIDGGVPGRSDNRPEHLELWTGRHPKGHRVQDVVKYCREMLAMYGTTDEQARYVEFRRAVETDPGTPVETEGDHE